MTPGTRVRGITLIEVMVSLAISAFISIIVVGVMSMVETSKRRTIAGSDLGQVAAYVQSSLDRSLRSAGSGFTQAATYAFGCQLHAAKTGQQVLPRLGSSPRRNATMVRSRVLAAVLPSIRLAMA